MTTAMKTRTKVGALAAAGAALGMSALAAAPAGATTADYAGRMWRCEPSGSVATGSKQLTNYGDKIVVTARRSANGCTTFRLEVPSYFSAANTPMYLTGNVGFFPYTMGYWDNEQVQGFVGEGGSAKTLSNGRNYYETGWIKSGGITFKAHTNWGVISITG